MKTPLELLIVEDSADDAELNVMTLDSAGFSVSARRVETEGAYRNAIAEKCPDVVLSDHSMPTFDAFRALGILKERNLDVPFIVVSGKVGETGAVMLMKAGASDYVIKNNMERLPPAVRREIREATNRKEVRHTEQQLFEKERLLSTLMDNLPGMVFRLSDSDTARFEFANEACTELTGYTSDELTGGRILYLRDLVDQADREWVQESLRKGIEDEGRITLEFRIRDVEGRSKWVWARVTEFCDKEGRPMGLEGFAADITERMETRQRLDYLANHDVLTGLANRKLFEEQFEQMLARARRLGHHVALLFVDLDHFKEINDSWGHQAGDHLLGLVAQRLRESVRGSDVTARLGGDEFGVVLDELPDAHAAATFADKLLAEIIRPFDALGGQVTISVSIGISAAPDDGETVGELLQNADAAMYSAKESGRNAYHFFAAEMNDRARRLLDLRNAVPRALQNNEFELEYQPRLSLVNGDAIVCVEGLIRWNDPEKGRIAAGEFMPLVERIGLVSDIDRWVLATGCRQLRAWRDRGLTRCRVALNLSARQFRNPELPGYMRDLLEQHDLPASSVEIEITETTMMEDIATTQQVMLELHDLGVLLTVDDFGTGYSSLNYLKRFPIDYLKIDMDFTAGLPDNTDDARITRAIIALARSLDIGVVAEGVERKDQENFLRALNCDEGQGFLYARSMPVDRMTELLEKQSMDKTGK